MKNQVKELMEDIRNRIKEDGECKITIKADEQEGMSCLAVNVWYPYKEMKK